MITKTKILKFSREAWKLPIVCDLARKHNVTFSILKADVLPRQEGVLILEISGENGDFARAIDFLRQQPGLTVAAIEQEIVHDEGVCTQCGACSGFCPSGALYIADRHTMEVVFNADKCIGCNLCLAACPSRALSTTTDLAV